MALYTFLAIQILGQAVSCNRVFKGTAEVCFIENLYFLLKLCSPETEFLDTLQFQNSYLQVRLQIAAFICGQHVFMKS